MNGQLPAACVRTARRTSPSRAALSLASCLFLSAALALLAAGCASSSGGGYQSGASGDQSAAQRAAQAKTRNPPTPPATPAAPPGEVAGGGIFNIFLSSPGARAPENVGYLVVEGVGPGASLFIDGDLQSGMSVTLPSGVHSLELINFGYVDYNSQITIAQGATLRLPVQLLPAAFALEQIDLRQNRFDPADPGFLGSCELELTATAPGSVDVKIVDAAGRVVRSFDDVSLPSRTTELRWNGRDGADRTLPPGSYSFKVFVRGSETVSQEASVSLEKGRFDRSSSLYSGVSGALLAPDARTLASGEVEAALDALGHIEVLNHAMAGRGTLDAGFRVGIPAPAGGMELALSALTTLYPGNMESPSPDSWTATAAFKYGFVQGPAGAMAAYAKLSLASFMDESASGWPPAWDGPTRYAGLSAGMTFELSSGPARLFVSPEVESSTFYPGYDDALWQVPGFFVWGYLRAGLELKADAATISLSAAAKSDPFGAEPPLLRLPLAFGAELRWHAPQSPFVLSLMATGEYWNEGEYYVSAGLGATLRF